LKRIAVLGIGAHALPSSRALLNRLADRYSITVYSDVVIKPEWLNYLHRYTIKSTVSRVWPRRFRDLLLFLVILKDHLRNPFQIFHAHSNYPTGFVAVLLQKVLRVPALVALEGGEAVALPDIKFGDLASKRRTKLNRWIINEAKAVTALTTYQCDQVRNNLGVTRPITILPRGVDENVFKERKKDVGSPIVFLNVGYLSPVKDPETLIRTFHLIQQKKNCVLIQVGKDYMNDATQRLANELGITDKVRFVGHVPHAEVIQYYAQSDILLLTSRYESQGVVVAEAIATGLIACGTKVGLMADLSGSCCVTAEVGEHENLANAILALLDDPGRMDELRSNGRAWSSQHTLEQCANEYYKIYEVL